MTEQAIFIKSTLKNDPSYEFIDIGEVISKINIV
jgi:hypothetical protein